MYGLNDWNIHSTMPYLYIVYVGIPILLDL